MFKRSIVSVSRWGTGKAGKPLLSRNNSIFFIFVGGIVALLCTAATLQNDRTCISFGGLIQTGPNFVIVNLMGDSTGVMPHSEQILTCVRQIRTFNQNGQIYVIVDDLQNDLAAEQLARETVLFRKTDIPFSLEHNFFRNHSQLDPFTRGGFWRHASERFFYMADLARKLQLQDIIFMASFY